MSLSQLSSYMQGRPFAALRSHRGDYQAFSLPVPISVLIQLTPRPDPNRPFEDNRLVNEAHARKFGTYWETHTAWITPPVLLDTELALGKSFEEFDSGAGLAAGMLTLPFDSAQHLRILDGQHRILGWTIQSESIRARVDSAKDQLKKSRDAENEPGVASYLEKVAYLESLRERMNNEFITVEVLVGVSREQHRKFFVDIADNARSISRSRTAAFNQERMMDREGVALADEHPLLNGRVDEERDRVPIGAPDLLSLKNTIELVRESTWGIPSRWTLRRENLNKEAVLRDLAHGFFDTLIDTFSDLDEVASGELSPAALRRKSLLGSVSMLRVLAGVYAATAVTGTDENRPEVTPSGVARFKCLCESLAPAMAFVEVEEGVTTLPPVWFEGETARFFDSPDAKAPVARSQNMKAFVELLTQWAEAGVAFSPTVTTPSSSSR